MLSTEWSEDKRSYKATCRDCGGTEEGSTDTYINAIAMLNQADKRHTSCEQQGDE